jgi:hypothetical protein
MVQKRVTDDKLKWYKFFNNRGIEYHWYKNYDNDKNENPYQVIVFLDTGEMVEFTQYIGSLYLDFGEEGGIECYWQDNNIAVNFYPILMYYEIEPEEIFPMTDEDKQSCGLL